MKNVVQKGAFLSELEKSRQPKHLWKAGSQGIAVKKDRGCVVEVGDGLSLL